jgi:predicted TIM-barrel fold metal-dependent hydrolase
MPTVIDIHPHIIADDTKRYPLAPLGGHQSDWSRTRPVTTEQMIAAMDKAGVAKAAIVQASTCYGHDNSYVADAVAAHPDRFTGVFSVDVLAPDAPERMRHWVGRNLTGLRLFTIGSTMPDQASWLDDPKSFPAWECAGELGLSICLQMSAKAFPQMIRMIERFQSARASRSLRAPPGDGPPMRPLTACSLAKYPTVFLKLTQRNCRSRAKPSHAGDLLPRLVSAFGASRLAWGSNYPPFRLAVDLLALATSSAQSVSSSDQEWIFAKTA